MVNFLVAFDNQDISLGKYFEQSKADIAKFINDNCDVANVHEIPSPLCNQAYIDIQMAGINARRFFFLAYTHGREDCLVAAGNYFIKRGINSHLFPKAFFYAMSCLTGKSLGGDLINNGCHVFIGFKEEAEALIGPYQNLSISCDNHAIKKFIQGLPAGECFQLMKENFTKEVDDLEANGEIILAAYLAFNRDALVFEGEADLVFSDFIVD